MKKDKKHISGVVGLKQKEKKDIYQIKDFVPSNLIDTVVHQQPLKKFPIQNIEQFKADHIPNTLLEEWDYKTPEELNKETEENIPENSNLFRDEDHLKITSNLPFSLILQTENNIEWKRPSEYVLNYYLDQQIQILYPKKNYISTRENMKQYHLKILRENALKNEMNKKENNELEEEDEEEENIDFFLKDDEEMRKMNMYKELLSILSKEFEYKIVNTEKILENEDAIIEKKEENRRTKKRKESKKLNIDNKKNIVGDTDKDKNALNNDETDKKYTLVIKPSNIYLQNFLRDENLHNSFYSWLSSVYQLIVDLKIPDLETGKTIFSNIYPQKDGIPYYNPKGKYIIKLYQHGKPRKIIIDDRMPCNRYFEYILPQCKNVEELWPAIFFKALLKLNLYKIRHPSYYYNEEFMDASVIYSLTGMQVITLDLNSKLLGIFRNKFNISEENGKKKNEKKFFALYNKHKTRRMNFNRSKSYYDIQAEYDFKNQINGTYINNYNFQGKNIIPFQRGEKIFLKARERSSSIIEKHLLNFGMTNKGKNVKENKNEKDKPKIFLEENKEFQEQEEKRRIPERKSSKRLKFQRGKNKKQTTVIKDIPIPTGELKRKQKSIELIDENNNLIYNYLYAVDDFFCNDNFNMNRLNFLDFSDLQKDLDDKKVEFKRLPPEQKKQYIIDRKKLKSEKLEEKKHRILSLKQSGTNYNLIHIVNETDGLPKLNYFKEYSSEKVELAKKCLLNRWEFPPPSTFENEFLIASEIQKKLRNLKNLEDKVISYKGKKENRKDKPIGLFTWTREMYEELIGGNDVLNLYKGNEKVPKKSKIENGGWVAFEEVCKRFNKLIIVQNTKFCYKENLYVDNTWNNYKTDEFHPSEDNAVFLLVKTPIEEFSSGDDINGDRGDASKKKAVKKKDNNKNKKEEEEKTQSDVSILSENKNNNPNNSILIVFEPLNEEFQPNKKINEIFYPYISLDLCEKETNIQIKKNIILNNFYSVFYYPYLSKEKEYYIKINSGFTPFGYNFQIFSDYYKIQHISINTFLKYFCGFNEFNAVAETPGPIEKNKNYMISKLSFITKDINNIDKLKFKVDVKHEYYFLKKYINIFLVKDNPNYKKEIEPEKLFSLEGKNNSFYYNKISPNDEYYFIFYIKSEFDLPETEFNIKILYNNSNITFNEIYNLEPFEITDLYYKNKDSILFSYFIYPSEKIYASLDINFYHFKQSEKRSINMNNIKSSPSSTIITSNEKLQSIDKCEICMLDKDENLHINLELYQLTKEPSLDFIDNAMKFSYSNQGELIRQWKFTNSLSISNFIFIGDVLPDLKKKKSTGGKTEKNSSENEEEEKKLYPYVLLCYVDVQKLSDLNIPNDLGFVIRIYSSNSIAFIKDRTKEEHEKKMKEKWEENDEGRGELAVKSRKKFLVFAKNLKKEKLSENELKILNEDRQRRSANEIDHIIDENENKNNSNNYKIKKLKKNELKQNNNKEKQKNVASPIKNRNNPLNNEEEETMQSNNMLTRNIINHINKRARPLSMENIFRQKRPVSRGTKSQYILNFIDYSNKERTIYIKKLEKMPLLRNKNLIRNNKFIISDEKYREKVKGNIINKVKESENELKKNNENFIKVTHDLAEGINKINKNLNSQRRAQSISKESLLNRRKKLQDIIQKRFDIKREILFYNDENKKILENLEKNKKELNNKKGDLLNYEELIKIYKEGNILLGYKDNDLINFFSIISKIKEEEIKSEFERVKSTNDKNKDNIISKMIEDIELNKWNINQELVEKLKLEVQAKNSN